MLVGMASKISKNYTYKCVDRSRHNGIKGAKAKCTQLEGAAVFSCLVDEGTVPPIKNSEPVFI